MINNNDHFVAIGALWEQYQDAWIESKGKKGDLTKTSVKTLISRMKQIAAQATACAQELAATPLAAIPAAVPFDENGRKLESVAGLELYKKRNEGDCIVRVFNSQKELVTEQNAHSEQLLPFSNKFVFTKANPEANKLTLTLTFDGDEHLFLHLLTFIYSGRISSKAYRSAAIQSFGKTYGIESLNNRHVITAPPQDPLLTIQRLAKAASLQELKEACQALLDRGLPLSTTAIYSIGRQLVSWKERNSHLENLEEITPFIQKIQALLADYTNKSITVISTAKSSWQPAPSNPANIIPINPYLKVMLNAQANTLSKTPGMLYLAKSPVYCLEPVMTVLEDTEGSFNGVVMGTITDMANTMQIFYLQASPNNTRRIRVERTKNPEHYFAPGDIMFMDEWPLKVEVSNDLGIIKKGVKSTINPEIEFEGHEEHCHNKKVATARTLYQTIATYATSLIQAATPIASTKGQMAKHSYDIQKLDMSGKNPSLDPLYFFQNAVKTHACLTKRASECDFPGRVEYAFRLPRNCLVEKSLVKEKQYSFVFSDLQEFVFPHTAIKNKMIHADAGYKSDADVSFTLEGSATDFENRALIAFLKNEAVPQDKITINQFIKLLSLAERFDMQSLISVAKNYYLHPKQLVNSEPLQLESFKRLRRHGQHDILNALLKYEGAPTADDIINRIVTLLPTPTSETGEQDKQLLLKVGEALSNSNGATIAALLHWTKEKEYTQLHEAISKQIKLSSNPFILPPSS